MKRINLTVAVCVAALIFGVMADSVLGRNNKMFDVPQNKRPEWGTHWCAPTAVGNSFAWLAKEYPNLAGLMKVNGTGAARSAEDIIDDLGKNYMGTSPTAGTTGANILKGKQDYIKAHGLESVITIETAVSPSKKWLKEQYDKGQDIELGLGYYELVGGAWVRRGGHIQTYGVIPGFDVGGHAVSLADIDDPFAGLDDSDFQVTFTDPGRDDVTGDYGAIGHDQYNLTDYAGVTWACTSSTYNMLWEADLFGVGQGGYLLEGYQGAGDFGAASSSTRTVATVVEIAWAESPIPAPGAMLLGGIGVVVAGYLRRRKVL